MLCLKGKRQQPSHLSVTNPQILVRATDRLVHSGGGANVLALGYHKVRLLTPSVLTQRLADGSPCVMPQSWLLQTLICCAKTNLVCIPSMLDDAQRRPSKGGGFHNTGMRHAEATSANTTAALFCAGAWWVLLLLLSLLWLFRDELACMPKSLCQISCSWSESDVLITPNVSTYEHACISLSETP